MDNDSKPSKEELKKKLHEKLQYKRIARSGKKRQENMLDKTFKEMGIDKEKFKQDLENVKKQGGLTMNHSI